VEELIESVTTGTEPGDWQLEVSFTLTDKDGDGVTGIGCEAIRFFFPTSYRQAPPPGLEGLEKASGIPTILNAGLIVPTSNPGTLTEVGDFNYTYKSGRLS
jgi:hypothetical protein